MPTHSSRAPRRRQAGRSAWRLWLTTLSLLQLASCNRQAPVIVSANGVAPSPPYYDYGPVSPAPLPALANDGAESSIALGVRGSPRSYGGPAEIERGTGRYVSGDTGADAARPPPIAPGGPASLDFVGVEAREVVRNVLGELLHVPYIVDPAVQGAVTLQTAQPVPRASVIPLLENALRLNGITLLVRNGTYVVLPLANAAREAPLGAGSGFVTRTVSAQYVAAADIARLLEPLTPAGATIRADPARNLLIVSGPETLVADILRNIQVFDVDYMRGVSFALLPLRNAQAKTVASEIAVLLGSGAGATAGLVKIVPLERLNALLVTAIQPAYLDKVRAWVSRLDRSGGSSTERRLYVYRVQNGRAADLAGVLRKALGLETSGGGAGSAAPPAGTATALPDVNSPGGGGSGGFTGNVQAGGQSGANPLLGGLTSPTEAAQPSAPDAGGGGEGSGGQSGGVRVTADEVNNALVIMASPQEYDVIEAALQKLDILPVQVLIETTIAEVDLTDQLNYGLQYYLKSGNIQALFSSASTGAVNSVFSGFNFVPGFNFAFGSNGGSSAILELLQQLTTVKVLSSPNLMVLNNQSARLQVGDQVPIATGSAVSTVSSGAPIVNSIAYQDTGIILKVTPRVNASGLVLLDVSQEVSQVSTTTTSSLDSPTISQRRVTSSVAVNDGETIALGGLISDNRSTSKNGIPILQDIPLLGFLFGTRNNSDTRTELIALITPRIVRNRFEGRQVTDELRQKLPLVAPIAPQSLLPPLQPR